MGRVIVVAATVGTLVLGIAVPRAHSSEIVFSNLDAAGEYLPNVGTTLGVVSGQDVDFAASFIPSYRITGVRDGTAVPEPASLFMLVTGLAGMAAFRRRHHHGAPRMWRSRPDGSSTNRQEDPHAV